jgi:hypothetical protein
VRLAGRVVARIAGTGQGQGRGGDRSTASTGGPRARRGVPREATQRRAREGPVGAVGRSERGPACAGSFCEATRGCKGGLALEAPACDAGAGRKFRPPASRILSRLDGKTGGLLRELNELDQTNNESYGVILLRRLDRLTPPQTVAFELDPMGVMNDTIENGVGDCGITNYIVPLFDRNLACDEK